MMTDFKVGDRVTVDLESLISFIGYEYEFLTDFERHSFAHGKVRLTGRVLKVTKSSAYIKYDEEGGDPSDTIDIPIKGSIISRRPLIMRNK